jgi:molecular chaperone GrpE
MFSIQDELRALQPIVIGGPEENAPAPFMDNAPTTWDVVAKALGRLGKQQLRATQQTELAIEELKAALERSKAMQEDLREQADEHRRRTQRLEAEGRDARLAALSILDALDDLATVARQKNDPQWTSRVERLTARTLEALAEMGLTEVPSADVAFDERAHEIVDTTDRGTRDPYQVVDVLRRGFRYQGMVLRRAQVVTTR